MIETTGASPGQIRVFAEYTGDVRESCDVVVVGSGPTGAVAAYELACAGKDVILLEEGPPVIPSEFVWEGSLSMTRLMREAGLRATGGTILSTMQTNVLGGGSVVNSAICVRPPPFVFDAWATGYELGDVSREELEPHFDAVSEFLGIAPTPDAVQGERNLLFRKACDSIGISSEPIARNVRGCVGSGECFTGCRARAKQSMDISYVPAAIRKGVRVLTSVQVRGVRSEGRRVLGVDGVVVAPYTADKPGAPSHEVRIDAKGVVLAAGCMATPVILQKSGDLANGSGQVGENLQFHPGTAVMGVMPDLVNPQFGATQGYQSLQFLEEGFKLETLWAPPGVFGVRMPGFGHDLKRRTADLPYATVFDAIASCHRSTGRVRARRGRSMDPKLTWHFHPGDVEVLARASFVIAELFFSIGARKILPGIHGIPEEIHSLEEAEVLRTREFKATDFVNASTHAFCSTRMHGDPKHGVVDGGGKAHDVDNLWILDTGIFPRCTSVNPMLTGMALAHRGAGRIAEEI